MIRAITKAIPSEKLISGCTTKHTSWDKLIQAVTPSHWPTVTMNQTHSANVCEIMTDHIAQKNEVPDTDAMWTCQPEVILRVRTADCLPILIYHPKGIIGAIHAGRKGTQNRITYKTFQHILDHHPDNERYTIWLGPAICKACYQIDPIQDLHYDLVRENIDQLKQIVNIETCTVIQSGLCTACKNNDFYSYRKEKTDKRLYSFIAQRTKE